MSVHEKMQFRLSTFGFVFQDYALLPELTVLENVALPLLMQGLTKAEAYARSTEMLKRADLGHQSGECMLDRRVGYGIAWDGNGISFLHEETDDCRRNNPVAQKHQDLPIEYERDDIG